MHKPLQAENRSARRQELLRVFNSLFDHYGKLHWWPAETPFEVCVGAILTQNTNWGNVEKAIANLKKADLLSATTLRDVPVEELAQVIKPAGFFNVKSARLKDFVGWLFERYLGRLEAMFAGDWLELREELLKVRGIGRETCDSILLYAGNKPSFVVDAYTKRLFTHLGLVSAKDDYEAVRALFMDNLPADAALFNDFHALIVQHCKVHCRKKPLCSGCRLHLSCNGS
ncbi:endonuclease III domain-containing protein [Geotalea toluenoxydans]|nr:endonuclease III domain-containing protein [Geotalea toluenoxydans]